MKLHKVPRNSFVRILDDDVQVPPAAPHLHPEQILHFHHIDGMYSYCIDCYGNVVHMAAWTDVEIMEDMTREDFYRNPVPQD